MAVCRKCNNSVPADSLKMDLDESIMVCSACIHNKRLKEELTETALKKKTKPEAQLKTPPQIVSDRRKYSCEICKYTFIVDFDKEYPRVCPYCSRAVRFK